jgi:hypothetical protein
MISATVLAAGGFTAVCFGLQAGLLLAWTGAGRPGRAAGRATAGAARVWR